MVGEKHKIPFEMQQDVQFDLRAWINENYMDGQRLVFQIIHTHPSSGPTPTVLSNNDIGSTHEWKAWLDDLGVHGFLEMTAITKVLLGADVIRGRFRPYFHNPTYVVELQ